MMKRLWPMLLLLAACAKPPITDELTIEPEREDDTIVITLATSFTLKPANDFARARVEAARAAALSATDPWSIRFDRLSVPEEERVTYQKSRGTLERVTRVARVSSDDLQHLLSDTNITVDVLRGEGWRELTFYPGSGGRATREQQREFDAELTTWSQSVARYFSAVHRLYSYLRLNPQRDRDVFTALLGDKEVLLAEEEQPFVDDVLAAMEEIADRMDAQDDRADTFAEQADLIFNPFPARVTIRVPGDVLASEGFQKSGKSGDLVIEPVDLFAAIGALEGQWISPDPLVALLRDERPAPEEIAKLPRKSEAVVSGGEVARAIRDQLQRPRMYSVRWRS